MSKTTSLDRRRFLTVSAGAALGATALSACANSVGDSKGGSGGGTASKTLTIMSTENDFNADMRKAAEKALGVKIRFVPSDQTKLNAMLASGTRRTWCAASARWTRRTSRPAG